jgi:ferrochelatase
LSREPIAVVVFQLGGPDSLAAVEPFLYNLLSDADIIDFPFARLARPTLARLISSRRARHVQEHYASMGGKSPFATHRLQVCLERELRECRLDARHRGHALLASLTAQAVGRSCVVRRLILLPLYPLF